MRFEGTRTDVVRKTAIETFYPSRRSNCRDGRNPDAGAGSTGTRTGDGVCPESLLPLPSNHHSGAFPTSGARTPASTHIPEFPEIAGPRPCPPGIAVTRRADVVVGAGWTPHYR